MIALPYGEKTMTICSAVFMQYQHVTDGQTDRRTDRIAISISRVSLLTRDKNGRMVAYTTGNNALQFQGQGHQAD